VGDDHVLVCAGRLVEVGPAVEPEGLGDVDLDVVDEVPVPDRLEEPVREAQGEDVLRRLLAEEMVNSEDLRLVERLVHPLVERDRAFQVGAERFLHDHTGVLDELRFLQHFDHRDRSGGRHAEVVQPHATLPELLLRLGYGGRQLLRACRARHVAQDLGELLPLLRREPLTDPAFQGDILEVAVLLGRGLGERLEVLVAHLLERRGNDPDRRREARGCQVRETGQQLAAREVAGGPEKHDHMGRDALGLLAIWA
jgi:hypothetical protein